MRLPRTVTAAVKPGEGQCSSSAWRSFRPLRILILALLVGALGLGLTLNWGWRGLAGDEPGASRSLGSLLRTASPLVVFSEFGEGADTLWAANPDDPTDRAQLGRVEHARGYGISPRLSPDGARIAYTVLPSDGLVPGRGEAAELWLLETRTGETRRLAEGVDLLITPVWSAEADAVVVRRSQQYEEDSGSAQLLRIDLTGAVTTLAAAEAGLYPIDFSPDGSWLYYAVLAPGGTELARAPAVGGGEAQTVAHLSDGVARDWHLSPDGTRLAYLAQTSEGGDIAFVAQVLDLAAGEARPPLADAALAQFNPIWERDSVLTIGRLARGGAGGAPVRLSIDGGAVAAAAPLPGPPTEETGFDVPLSWSPDGLHLAVRSFEGTSTADPGPSRVVVLSTAGERHALSPLSDVAIAGWLEALE